MIFLILFKLYTCETRIIIIIDNQVVRKIKIVNNQVLRKIKIAVKSDIKNWAYISLR